MQSNAFQFVILYISLSVPNFSNNSSRDNGWRCLQFCCKSCSSAVLNVVIKSLIDGTVVELISQT